MRKFRIIIFAVAIVFLLAFAASAENGLVQVKSPYDVKTTADRLVNVLKDKGMTVFDRIDHAKNARKVDKTLPPTVVVIFGNPKVGTPLMQCSRTMAIDLPQKALIWEDEEGQVRLAYNDPAYLAERHNITGCDEALQKVEKALQNFAQAATAQKKE